MFESIISVNFDAVALLRYGLFDESLEQLRGAVTAIQATESLPVQQDVGFSSPKLSSVLVVDQQGKLCSTKARGMVQTNCSDMFMRGFIFEDADSLPFTDENSAVCASVCLYNMALTVHLRARSNSGTTNHLRRASGLYQKVYSILSGLPPTYAESISVLFLATALNIIACENELLGYSAADEWKRMYSSLFSWATQTSSFPAVFDYPQELAFFTTSAIVFYNQKLAAAPAA